MKVCRWYAKLYDFFLLFFFSTKDLKYVVFQAKAGENIGVNLRDIKKTNIRRGMILCQRNSERILNHFDASIYMLTKNEGGRSKPILSKYTHTIFSRTWNTPCRVDFRM